MNAISYKQLRAFAAQYGAVVGLMWIVSFAFYIIDVYKRQAACLATVCAGGCFFKKEQTNRKERMKRLLSTIITVAVTAGLKAQLLALKTDALWDGLMTPNLGMEIVTGNKTSFGLSVFGNYKPWGMDMKMVGAIPEFRYWFGGRPMMREFIGVAALGTCLLYTSHCRDP